MKKVSSKHTTLQADEATYDQWQAFFKDSSNHPITQPAILGLQGLVRYCTYLREMNAILERETVWYGPAFIFGCIVGLPIGALIYFLVAH